MPKCPSGKIVNPRTGRCVNIDGKIGKELLKKRSSSKKSFSKSSKKKSSKRKSVKVSKSPRRKPSKVRKSSVKSRGCNEQHTAKYVNRKSPSYPANECCGMVMVGNDGQHYLSKPNKNGVCRWIKFGSAKP